MNRIKTTIEKSSTPSENLRAKRVWRNKKKIIQSSSTQMNFGLQYNIKILCISKHSIRNICDGLKMDFIWRNLPNMALRDDITLSMIYDIIKLFKENLERNLGDSRLFMAGHLRLLLCKNLSLQGFFSKYILFPRI